MKTLHTLENSIQPYAWGSLDGISSFTGIPNRSGKPMAELWMGAHPAAPSTVTAPDFATPMPVALDALISGNPEGFLGKDVAGRFTDKLPFLFKVLSAASPLSLQVHPTKKQAENGFARDNRAGIPLSSPDRNYRDDNHKPEIIMAVTPFTAMCGFRAISETTALFASLGIPELNAAAEELRNSGSYTGFCRTLLELSPERSATLSLPVIARARKMIAAADRPPHLRALELLLELASHYPGDTGILAPLYLNVLDLKPGQALYLRAGIMHAYVRGTGLELMASSDNVLRGGLTPKHIDIPELLSVLDPAPYAPEIIEPECVRGICRYRTESEEFELCRIETDREPVSVDADGPAIVIGASGNLVVTAGTDEREPISKGKTLFAAATGKTLVFSGTGTCYMGTVPETGNKRS